MAAAAAIRLLSLQEFGSVTVAVCMFTLRCIDKALADNRCLTIGQLSADCRLIQKHILMSYLSCLFILRLLSEDSYVLEGLQSADKTKMHPKAKLQNAPTFTGNGSHSHVSTNDIYRCIHKLHFSDM